MAKRQLRKGSCKIIRTSAGRRKICRLKNGKVKFAPLSGTKTRKRKTTKRKKRR